MGYWLWPPAKSVTDDVCVQGKASGMENAAAQPAPRASCGIGEVPVIGEQQLMEIGVGQQVSVQGVRPPRREGADYYGQVRTQ
jgi:hypothetical protein